MGKKNFNSNSACSTEIPFGWTETETDRSILSYPSDVPNLMESLDSGHTTVKTENSQPGLSQGQDPSSRVLLRSTRVATHPLLFIAVDSNPFLNSAYLTASSILLWKVTSSGS